MLLNFLKKRLLIACLLLFTILLGGCGILSGREPTETETEPPTPTYSVRLMVKGEEVTAAEVPEGQCPTVPLEIPGLSITGWLDANNRPVSPASTPVFADTVYYAVAYPILSSHVPFLFPDDTGSLWPDAPLTARDLSTAIYEVAAEAARPYLTDIAEDTVITAETLRDILQTYFPVETVTTATQTLPEGEVTRGAFAQSMVWLLERSDETILLSDSWTLPTELGFGQDYIYAVLEAAIPHSPDSAGVTWEAAVAGALWEPGYFNRDGWLYYSDEEGILVRDTQVGLLTFGSDGRYTSGDAELDEMVAEILSGILSDNPEAERIDLLRRAFEYCRDSFTYLRKSPYAFGATGWEVEDAKVMFTKLHGNCYNFAAAFWALARGLGYDALGISGTMTATYQPHGWVEIEFDGNYYVFDAEMEYVYVHERDRHDMDMFMVSYSKGEYWTYRRPKK